MTRRWLTLITLGAILTLPRLAGAEGETCATATTIVPDGRIITSTIPAGLTYYFQVTQRTGSSYSVEFHNAIGVAGETPGTLTVYFDSSCTTAINGIQDTTAIEPADPNGRRVSYTTFENQNPTYRLKLSNGSSSTITYSFSVSETALYSALWSSSMNQNTYYSFVNTTSGSITCTLTLTTAAGVFAAATTFTIGPGLSASTNTVAMNVAPGLTGTARLTHNGPPGAILIEADIADSTTTPPYIQPVKFTAVRERTR